MNFMTVELPMFESERAKHLLLAGDISGESVEDCAVLALFEEAMDVADGMGSPQKRAKLTTGAAGDAKPQPAAEPEADAPKAADAARSTEGPSAEAAAIPKPANGKGASGGSRRRVPAQLETVTTGRQQRSKAGKAATRLGADDNWGSGAAGAWRSVGKPADGSKGRDDGKGGAGEGSRAAAEVTAQSHVDQSVVKQPEGSGWGAPVAQRKSGGAKRGRPADQSTRPPPSTMRQASSELSASLHADACTGAAANAAATAAAFAEAIGDESGHFNPSRNWSCTSCNSLDTTVSFASTTAFVDAPMPLPAPAGPPLAIASDLFDVLHDGPPADATGGLAAMAKPAKKPRRPRSDWPRRKKVPANCAAGAGGATGDGATAGAAAGSFAGAQSPDANASTASTRPASRQATPSKTSSSLSLGGAVAGSVFGTVAGSGTASTNSALPAASAPAPGLGGVRLPSSSALASSAPRGFVYAIERKEWTAAEDAIIRDAVLADGFKWRRIAARLPGRSDDAVRNRWNRLSEDKNAEGAGGSGASPQGLSNARGAIAGGDATSAFAAPTSAIPSPFGVSDGVAVDDATAGASQKLPKKKAAHADGSDVLFACSMDDSRAAAAGEGMTLAVASLNGATLTQSSDATSEASSEEASAAQGCLAFAPPTALAAPPAPRPKPSRPRSKPRAQRPSGAPPTRVVWSTEEDHAILRFVREYGHKWFLLKQQYLPTRTEHAIRNRYHRLQTICLEDQDAAAALTAGAASMHMPPGAASMLVAESVAAAAHIDDHIDATQGGSVVHTDATVSPAAAESGEGLTSGEGLDGGRLHGLASLDGGLVGGLGELGGYDIAMHEPSYDMAMEGTMAGAPEWAMVGAMEPMDPASFLE